MKLQLCLLMLVLGVVYVQSARLTRPDMDDIPEEEQDETKRGGRHYYGNCDWPVGYCVYKFDPCPPHMIPCHYHYHCALRTNKCCCWPGGYRRS